MLLNINLLKSFNILLYLGILLIVLFSIFTFTIPIKQIVGETSPSTTYPVSTMRAENVFFSLKPTPTIEPVESKKANTIFEYELETMKRPYIPIGTQNPLVTFKPSTSYCNTLVKLNAMNYLQDRLEWTPKQRIEVLSLINTALELTLEQRQLLVLLSNIQLRSLIDINCLLLKNDPNYINITNYTQWDASYKNAVVSNIYTLIEGPKTDYVYSTYSILPFLQSLTNSQLYKIIS